VSGLNGRCKHLFAITALDKFFEIRPTAELAIAELSESGHSPPFVG
jgi:stage II sporulation protein AA (anti-sigma F factor antagonist)